MLSTSGQHSAAAPTTVVAPVSRYRKSRRVPSSRAVPLSVAAMSAIVLRPGFVPGAVWKPGEI